MLEKYSDVDISTDFKTFEFDSLGRKGKVRKVVVYTEFEYEGYFNLGFGDKNIQSGELDDLVVTNNGDSEKVLATVASTLITFTERYPHATVILAGSTKARTRLYQMGISAKLAAINAYFNVWGLYENDWKPFEKGIDYDAFLVRRIL